MCGRAQQQRRPRPRCHHKNRHCGCGRRQQLQPRRRSELLATAVARRALVQHQHWVPHLLLHALVDVEQQVVAQLMLTPLMSTPWRLQPRPLLPPLPLLMTLLQQPTLLPKPPLKPPSAPTSRPGSTALQIYPPGSPHSRLATNNCRGMPYGTAAHRRTANRAADRCANTWYSRQAPRPPEWLRVEQVLQLARCHRRLRRRHRRHRPPNRHGHQSHHRRTATAVAAPTACEVPSNSVCASGGGSSCSVC